MSDPIMIFVAIGFAWVGGFCLGYILGRRREQKGNE